MDISKLISNYLRQETAPSPVPNPSWLKNLWFITAISSTLLFTNSAYSQEFGKLFTTPEEREYLDGLREKFLQRSDLEGFNIADEVKPWIEEELQEQNTEFEMAGVMTRKNGGRAVWLNGSAINETDLPSNLRIVEVDGQQMLRIRANSKIHTIRAGQTLDIETGSIRESYEPKPKQETNIIADSIKNVFQKDKEQGSDKKTSAPKRDSLAIDDMIDALQAIQETKGVK